MRMRFHDQTYTRVKCFMRTALSCFLEDRVPDAVLPVYDTDPGVRVYGIVDGKPIELEKVKDTKGRSTNRIIVSLEDIPDLEEAAWKLLVYVAKLQKTSETKTFDQKYTVEKDGTRVKVIDPEYMSRHIIKNDLHGLLVYNPGVIELLPSLH